MPRIGAGGGSIPIITGTSGVSEVATTPAAPATAGEQYAEKRISTGAYRISAASIHTANTYSEECRIALISLDANDNEVEACLAAGQVSGNKPFCLPTDRVVSGPAYIRAYVFNLAGTAFDFRLIVDKIEESKEAISKGSFGGWF